MMTKDTFLGIFPKKLIVFTMVIYNSVANEGFYLDYTSFAMNPTYIVMCNLHC